jgi:hypothetical protein
MPKNEKDAVRVAIQHGFASGKRQSIQLQKELRAKGYAVVSQALDADIIIAHSAGCFWLPAAPTHQRILLIDPPYWPGKSVRQRSSDRLRRNFQFRKYNYGFNLWLKRNLWGIFYSLRDLKYTWDIIKHAQQYDLAAIIHSHQAILVRNDDDDWLTSDLTGISKANPNLTIVRLPGDHDDCYYHPEAYVKLLASFTE